MGKRMVSEVTWIRCSKLKIKGSETKGVTKMSTGLMLHNFKLHVCSWEYESYGSQGVGTFVMGKHWTFNVVKPRFTVFFCTNRDVMLVLVTYNPYIK